MPSTTYSKPHTDHRTCKYCGTRVIFARTAEGRKLPPVNYSPGPAGKVAIHHDPTEGWIGRFLATSESPMVPEKRYAVHECDGTRHHARRRQRRGEARHSAGQPARRLQPPPAPGLWTTT